jgi:hypothetical protein
MTTPRRTRRAREDHPATLHPLSPFDVMDTPELAALALLEHAIDVARIAILAQHIGLLDPDPPCRRDPKPGDELTTPFFTSAHALTIVIRRYRAAVAQAVELDAERGRRSDDDV